MYLCYFWNNHFFKEFNKFFSFALPTSTTTCLVVASNTSPVLWSMIGTDDFNVDCVINVGVAGGIGKDIYPGDIVIADNLVEHDMDTTAFGDKHGQIPRMDTFDFKCKIGRAHV